MESATPVEKVSATPAEQGKPTPAEEESATMVEEELAMVALAMGSSNLVVARSNEWTRGVEPLTTQPPVRLAAGLDSGPIH